MWYWYYESSVSYIYFIYFISERFNINIYILFFAHKITIVTLQQAHTNSSDCFVLKVKFSKTNQTHIYGMANYINILLKLRILHITKKQNYFGATWPRDLNFNLCNIKLRIPILTLNSKCTLSLLNVRSF